MREAANKLDDRESSTTTNPLKCVWMLAGVVDYRLCDREFDCDRCAFDRAFRDNSRACAFKSDQRFTTSEGLRLTDLQGYEVAPMLFYHSAHVWARIEDKGIVRVGLDDFGQKLAGRIYSVQAPREGTTVGRGESCWRVTHHAGETALATPVSGTIHLVNSKLARHPSLINRDPYGEGWAFTIQPSGLEQCLAQLYYGRKVELWYERDIDRLYQAMNGLLVGSIPAVGATMQDGGSRVADFTSLLTADQMRHVIDSFLSANLSDQFPWGLWIGFDVLCGVARAAGGFTISAVVYIFGKAAELPAPAALRQPLMATTLLTLTVAGAFMIAAIGPAYSGIRLRPSPPDLAKAAAVEVDMTRGLERFNAPADLVFPKSEESPGVVTFRHSTHVDAASPNCTTCHSSQFKMLNIRMQPPPNATRWDMHNEQRCGACHNGEKSFSLKDADNCTNCHTQ